MRLVKPEVYLVGATKIEWMGMMKYLEDSGNQDFVKSYDAAFGAGLSDAEILCSFMTKLCYASLSVGKT